MNQVTGEPGAFNDADEGDNVSDISDINSSDIGKPKRPTRLWLEGASKAYGAKQAVDHVSLSIERGEIVGLLGPNGAGKTTAFAMATGLERPDRGRVWLNQREITRLSLQQRARLGIGYLAQEPSIFRHLSVQDNILLVLQQTQVPRSLWQNKLTSLLAEFRLEHVASTLGVRVSGGERRRTELARALAMGVKGPRFLFLDEPFAGIDPIAVAEIQEILQRLRNQQMGILITDHNVRETLQIIDRGYILREGKLLAEGTAAELYDSPLVRQYYLGDGFRW
jgi:lipopolysaccharide export system ATP-binding protein